MLAVLLKTQLFFFGNGGAAGILGDSANSVGYSNLWGNWASYILMGAVSGGVLLNPLIFGDALFNKDSGTLNGVIVHSCMVNNLSFVYDTECGSNAGSVSCIAAGDVDKDAGLGVVNCLATNCKIKSDGEKGAITGFVAKNNEYAVTDNNYYYNLKTDKKSNNKSIVDTKTAKKINKKKLVSKSFAKKLGNGYSYNAKKAPKLLKYNLDTNAVTADNKNALKDGYYYINYFNVDDDGLAVPSDDAGKFYFEYAGNGKYCFFTEDGRAMECVDGKIRAKKYDEHKLTQEWILEPNGEDKYVIKLWGTNEVIQKAGGWDWLINKSGLYMLTGGVDETVWTITAAESVNIDAEIVADYKPVIYLYGYDNERVNVQLEISGEFTTTYPSYDESIKGWSVTASKDGKLTTDDGRTYSYLFWEAKADKDVSWDYSKGFCVKGEDTIEFLYDKLFTLGLRGEEIDDFITFWAPKMIGNNYNIISFQDEIYKEHAKLSVDNEPENTIRVFMAVEPSTVFVEIEPQDIKSVHRAGGEKTLVEWGGSI